MRRTAAVAVLVGVLVVAVPAAAGLLPAPGPWPADVAGATNPLLGTSLAFNGGAAGVNVRLRVWLPLRGHRRAAITRTIGARTIVRGRLRNRDTRRSIAGAIVQLVAADVADGGWVLVGSARTNRLGVFRAVLPPGPTRRVAVLYWPLVSSPAAVFSRRLLVRASARVTMTTRTTGRSMMIRGRVDGAPIPPGGLLVAAQVRNGRSWATVRLVRCFAGGGFRARYRFKFHGRRFVVRALVPAQAGWPLYGGASRPQRVLTR